MYRIYYLTSEEDGNVPMYVGATKLELEGRLKGHIYEPGKKTNCSKWKKSRNDNISIHLIEDNINTIEEVQLKEFSWIEFWRAVNPLLTDHKKYVKYRTRLRKEKELPKPVIESNSLFKSTNNKTSIVVVNKNNELVGEYKSISACSLDHNLSHDTVRTCANDTRKIRGNYFFIYKCDYNPNVDYNYKACTETNGVMKRHTIMASVKVRSIPCYLKNIETGEETEFASMDACTQSLGLRNGTGFSFIKRKTPLLGKYKIYRKDIVQSS